MIRYIVLLLCVLPFYSHGQMDVFEFYYDFQKPFTQFEGSDHFIEYEYVLKMNENYRVDTILTLEGKEFQYQLDIVSHIDKDQGRYHITNTNGLGDTVSQGLIQLDKQGRVLRDRLIHAKNFRQGLDRDRKMVFNDQGQLINIIDQLCDSCAISSNIDIEYNDIGTISKLTILQREAGLMTISLSDSNTYEIERELSEMVKNRYKSYGQDSVVLPREYIKVTTFSDGSANFLAYKENMESHTMQLQWEKLRSKTGGIREFKLYKSGKLVAHTVYSLDDDDMILSAHNKLRDITIKYENIGNGKYTYRTKGSEDHYTVYDDESRWIKQWYKPKGAAYYTKLLLRHYDI